MGERQIGIFDYVDMRNDDSVYFQIKSLAPGETINVENLKIERTDRFYQVSLENEFESIFVIDEECYDFVRILISEKLNNEVEEDA